MNFLTPGNEHADARSLFDQNTSQRPTTFLCIAAGFALATVLGLVSDQSTLIVNGYILALGIYVVFAIFTWNKRFKNQIHRAQQVLWEYCRLSCIDILNRRESDRPFVSEILKAMALMAHRGRRPKHESLVRCLEQSLVEELGWFLAIGRALPQMGLIGTCTGLMATIFAIAAGAEDVSDLKALTDSIGSALPAMGLAVSTTMTAAWIGSLVISSLVSMSMNKLFKFTDELNAHLSMFRISKRSRTASKS